VAIATARHRQQRTCSQRKRRELRCRASLPNYDCLPRRTLRHASLFPQLPAGTPPSAQPSAQRREDPAFESPVPRAFQRRVAGVLADAGCVRCDARPARSS
jgi:hypothetical protein